MDVIELLQLIKTVYLSGALVAALILQHGFIRHGGDKYKSITAMLIFFCVQMFVWVIYLLVKPFIIKNMYNCSYMEAVDIMNQQMVSSIDRD